jgi:hypothetical protein
MRAALTLLIEGEEESYLVLEKWTQATAGRAR